MHEDLEDIGTWIVVIPFILQCNYHPIIGANCEGMQVMICIFAALIETRDGISLKLHASGGSKNL